jgi:hypothetical protein
MERRLAAIQPFHIAQDGEFFIRVALISAVVDRQG